MCASLFFQSIKFRVLAFFRVGRIHLVDIYFFYGGCFLVNMMPCFIWQNESTFTWFTDILGMVMQRWFILYTGEEANGYLQILVNDIYLLSSCQLPGFLRVGASNFQCMHVRDLTTSGNLQFWKAENNLSSCFLLFTKSSNVVSVLFYMFPLHNWLYYWIQHTP